MDGTSQRARTCKIRWNALLGKGRLGMTRTQSSHWGIPQQGVRLGPNRCQDRVCSAFPDAWGVRVYEFNLTLDQARSRSTRAPTTRDGDFAGRLVEPWAEPWGRAGRVFS
jgi:hypothetical protein